MSNGFSFLQAEAQGITADSVQELLRRTPNHEYTLAQGDEKYLVRRFFDDAQFRDKPSITRIGRGLTKGWIETTGKTTSIQPGTIFTPKRSAGPYLDPMRERYFENLPNTFLIVDIPNRRAIAEVSMRNEIDIADIHRLMTHTARWVPIKLSALGYENLSGADDEPTCAPCPDQLPSSIAAQKVLAGEPGGTWLEIMATVQRALIFLPFLYLTRGQPTWQKAAVTGLGLQFVIIARAAVKSRDLPTTFPPCACPNRLPSQMAAAALVNGDSSAIGRNFYHAVKRGVYLFPALWFLRGQKTWVAALAASAIISVFVVAEFRTKTNGISEIPGP